MYFSRLSLQQGAESTSDFWRVFRNPYTLHQSVWRLFSEESVIDRNFLYHLDLSHGHPTVFTVSSRRPSETDSVWIPQTKPYDPVLHAAMNLAFNLRVNPVIKRDGKRHDVVMDAKWRERTKNEGSAPSSQAEIVQLECAGWLKTRAGHSGFEVESVRADSYKSHTFVKPKSKHRICFSTCDLQGILRVKNIEAFRHALYQGIGPAKGFGCGLLMVRRV